MRAEQRSHARHTSRRGTSKPGRRISEFAPDPRSRKGSTWGPSLPVGPARPIASLRPQGPPAATSVGTRFSFASRDEQYLGLSHRRVLTTGAGRSLRVAGGLSPRGIRSRDLARGNNSLCLGGGGGRRAPVRRTGCRLRDVCCTPSPGEGRGGAWITLACSC